MLAKIPGLEYIPVLAITSSCLESKFSEVRATKMDAAHKIGKCTNSTKASRATLSNNRNKCYSGDDIAEHSHLFGIAKMTRYDLGLIH
jgi:hypothetical protein